MVHLKQDLMDAGILGGDPQQRGAEFHSLRKILGTLPARFRVDEIALGHRPWRREYPLDRSEECGCEPVESLRARAAGVKKTFEDAHFLGGDAHSLSVGGIEAADHVADRQQTIRKAVKRLEPPPHAAGQSK